jgi:hypothetical protein
MLVLGRACGTRSTSLWFCKSKKSKVKVVRTHEVKTCEMIWTIQLRRARCAGSGISQVIKFQGQSREDSRSENS